MSQSVYFQIGNFLLLIISLKFCYWMNVSQISLSKIYPLIMQSEAREDSLHSLYYSLYNIVLCQVRELVPPWHYADIHSDQTSHR